MGKTLSIRINNEIRDYQVAAIMKDLPDTSHLAFDVIERCFHKGLLFFAPVGAWGQTVKISPPLTITQAAVEEGLAVLSESVDEAVAALA